MVPVKGKCTDFSVLLLVQVISFVKNDGQTYLQVRNFMVILTPDLEAFSDPYFRLVTAFCDFVYFLTISKEKHHV